MDIWQKGRILYETRNVMVVKMIHRGYCLQTDNVPLVKTEDFNASTDQNNLYSKKIMKNFISSITSRLRQQHQEKEKYMKKMVFNFAHNCCQSHTFLQLLLCAWHGFWMCQNNFSLIKIMQWKQKIQRFKQDLWWTRWTILSAPCIITIFLFILSIQNTLIRHSQNKNIIFHLFHWIS